MKTINMNVRWIEHKDKKILFNTYRGVKNQDQIIAILNEAYEIVSQSWGTILILTDVTKATIGPRFMEELKKYHLLSTSILGKSVILGGTGLKGAMLKNYNMFTKSIVTKSLERTMPFDTKEEALDYLVSE